MNCQWEEMRETGKEDTERWEMLLEMEIGSGRSLLIDVGFYCSKIMLLVNARSWLDKILGDHWFSMGTSGNGSVKRVDVNKWNKWSSCSCTHQYVLLCCVGWLCYCIYHIALFDIGCIMVIFYTLKSTWTSCGNMTVLSYLCTVFFFAHLTAICYSVR